MTGLADEVREVLEWGLQSCERRIDPAARRALRAAHEAVVSMCAEEERAAAVMTELLNDQQEALDDLG